MRFGYGIGIAYPPVWLETLQISRGIERRFEADMVFVLHSCIELPEEGSASCWAELTIYRAIRPPHAGGQRRYGARDRLTCRSRSTSVPSDADLPAAADVVVIGGGIIGVSTALFLAERGVSVVLCEKGDIARRAVEPQLGLGAATWAATRARSRWPSKACGSGAA